jgi:membrane associated rhomboid family serine protease
MSDAIAKKYSGLFSLVFINFFVFVLFNILQSSVAVMMVLNHEHPRWYQFVTSIFCHIDYMHLSSNMFFLYVFGRLIEEEEGASGLLFSFFVCGISANIIDYIFSAKTGASLGASGAVFGLFIIAILIKFKLTFINILECLILVPFVLGYISSEIAKMGKNDNIGHDAHIYGALAGVILIMSLRFRKKRLGNPV